MSKMSISPQTTTSEPNSATTVTTPSSTVLSTPVDEEVVSLEEDPLFPSHEEIGVSGGNHRVVHRLRAAAAVFPHPEKTIYPRQSWTTHEDKTSSYSSRDDVEEELNHLLEEAISQK